MKGQVGPGERTGWYFEWGILFFWNLNSRLSCFLVENMELVLCKAFLFWEPWLSCFLVEKKGVGILCKASRLDFASRLGRLNLALVVTSTT